MVIKVYVNSSFLLEKMKRILKSILRIDIKQKTWKGDMKWVLDKLHNTNKACETDLQHGAILFLFCCLFVCLFVCLACFVFLGPWMGDEWQTIYSVKGEVQ